VQWSSLQALKFFLGHAKFHQQNWAIINGMEKLAMSATASFALGSYDPELKVRTRIVVEAMDD
jgi:hypothetical protein